MKTVAVIVGLIFTCSDLLQNTAGNQLQGLAEPSVQTECRDRYLWIHVTSAQTPRFEAIDGNKVHQISEQLAALCGYTISSFKMDGSTTLKASYFSCFTHNQNDEAFTFSLNVKMADATSRWISKPVSVVCSGLIWTHREITCEEDYMEVNVNRDSSCGGLWGDSGQGWQAALSKAQRTASSVWQLMILKSEGQVSSMSIREAQGQGFSLTTSAQRIVLRSPYKQPHAELTVVDGIPMMVVRASLFKKQKLTVVMIDVSMACTVNPGSFDGTNLLWDIPLVMSPLTGMGPRFQSQNLSCGVEGVLLDKPSAAARGFHLVREGNVIQIRVPFGAKGGYRRSMVVNNSYKEMYVIFLLYEHVFSLMFEDGSSIDTKHRMLRVLDTPLLCRKPFSLDQTRKDDRKFSIYLGNIPADVTLEEVRINGQALMSKRAERGLRISAFDTNGTQAFEIQLPFEDAAVDLMYLGEGVLQYSIDANFTLTVMPQRDSYYHQTSLKAQVSNSFPPEITAQCSEGGISFSVVKPPRSESLWEVGVDQEPLTPELAAQRGYRLYSEADRTALEVPVFSIGYTYEDINLSNFYGTFQLLLRDSKTLEIQTSTSKRCLFKTQDMIVCSADGTMTVVTAPTSTWPTVRPDRTTLLDPRCGPTQTDGSRVLFEFKLNSCGTRVTVGESYVLYENEILHDRRMIIDGPNMISRESQFKLTVRCFYPLSGVSRLSVNRKFTSHTPGFGSVFESFKDSNDITSSQDCSQQDSGHAINKLTNQVQKPPVAPNVQPHFRMRPSPRSGSSHFFKFPNFPSFKLIPPQQVPLWGPLAALMAKEQPGSRLPTDFQLPNNPPVYGRSPDGVQLLKLNAQADPSRTKEHLGLSYSTPGMISGFPLEGNQHLQNSVMQESPDPKSFRFAPSMPERNNSDEATLEMSKSTEVPDYQPQTPIDPPQANQFQEVFKTPAPYSSENTSSDGLNQSQDKQGSVERRNAGTVKSRVQNVEVNPLSKSVSSGLSLNQKPVIQQAKPQRSVTSQNATGLNTDRSDRNYWTPQHLPDQRDSNIKEGHVPNLKKTWELVPNQPGHQQGVPKPTGASHIIVSGLEDRSLTYYGPEQQNLQNPSTQTDTRLSESNLTAGTAAITSSDPGFNGSGGSGSDPKIYTRSDCSQCNQYGASVHQGIVRGK